MKRSLFVSAVIILCVLYSFPIKAETTSDFALWQFKEQISGNPSMDIVLSRQYRNKDNDISGIFHYQYTYEPMSYLQSIEDMINGEYFKGCIYYVPTDDGYTEYGDISGKIGRLDANDRLLEDILADLPIQSVKMFALFIDNDMEVEQLEDEKVDEILCSVFRIKVNQAILKEQIQEGSDKEPVIVSPEVFAYYYFNADNGDAIRQTMEVEFIDDLNNADIVSQMSIDIRILAIGDKVAIVEPSKEAK